VIAGDLMEQGPAAVWFRLAAPVVAGEPVTPLMQAVSAADLISGISSVVSIRDWTFVNADLTMVFDRPPAGEWILVEAAMTAQADGTGQTRAWLSDRDGRFGQAMQSVLIEPRRPGA
jgi:acyl-CoA thioesterase